GEVGVLLVDVVEHDVAADARAPPDVGVAHGQVLQADVARRRELVSGGDAHLAPAVHDAGGAGDRDVVAVLDEDRVVARTRDVDLVDHRTAALGHAEDAASTAACLDASDPDVGGVSIADPPVAVGETQSGVAGARAGLVGVDPAHSRVPGVVQQKARLSGIPGGDPIDGQAVDPVRLHAVRAGAGDVDLTDADVPRRHAPVAVVVDPDAEAARQPHLDAAEDDVLDVAHEDAVERTAGEAEVLDLDVAHTAGVDRRLVTRTGPGDVDRAADVQDGVAGQGDAVVRADRTAAADDDALLAGSSRREAVDAGLDGCPHVAA